MAPNRGRNRTKEFADLEDGPAVDFDPEADLPSDAGSDSESDALDNGTENNAREHYARVGKSKLKQDKISSLGPQYRGSRIGRDAIADDEEDDPFAKGFDEISDSDDGFLEDDEHSESDVDDDDEEGSEELGSEAEDDDDDDQDDDSLDTDITDDEMDHRPRYTDGKSDERAAGLLETLAGKKSLANIQQANHTDAEKGRAVKQQRKAFDDLLNTRIKLQKALVGVNSSVAVPRADVEHIHEDQYAAIEAAESAALNLWSTLSSYRDEMTSARTGTKRKRSKYTTETPTAELYERLHEQDEASDIHWRATLQKWSAKTRGPTAIGEKKLLGKSDQVATIIDVINEQLSNSDRLIQRTRMPRSCAPVQSAKGITEDAAIYDDADFYGLLLKELLEQKGQDAVVTSNIDLSFQLRRENKTRKNVDTKASKGRKLRYTVHEKLQNFMAPEDRSTWGERQTDELFGSLFGQRLALGEDIGDQDEDEDMVETGLDEEEAGLLMFRS